MGLPDQLCRLESWVRRPWREGGGADRSRCDGVGRCDGGVGKRGDQDASEECSSQACCRHGCAARSARLAPRRKRRVGKRHVPRRVHSEDLHDSWRAKMGDAWARKTKTRLHILGHLSTVSDPGGSPPELFPECSTPDFGSSGLDRVLACASSSCTCSVQRARRSSHDGYDAATPSCHTRRTGRSLTKKH